MFIVILKKTIFLALLYSHLFENEHRITSHIIYNEFVVLSLHSAGTSGVRLSFCSKYAGFTYYFILPILLIICYRTLYENKGKTLLQTLLEKLSHTTEICLTYSATVGAG